MSNQVCSAKTLGKLRGEIGFETANSRLLIPPSGGAGVFYTGDIESLFFSQFISQGYRNVNSLHFYLLSVAMDAYTNNMNIIWEVNVSLLYYNPVCTNT